MFTHLQVLLRGYWIAVQDFSLRVAKYVLISIVVACEYIIIML